MSTGGSVFDWFPHDLAYIALRLARADALQEELGRACLNWSENALELRQVRRSNGLFDVLVDQLRPIPPIVELLFSEIVNHLRSAIDNVVYFVVERERGSPLPDDAAHLVAMPIVQTADALENWANGHRDLAATPTARTVRRHWRNGRGTHRSRQS